MRRRIRLKESEIKNIVRRSVKKVLKEATLDNDVNLKWDYLLDTIGAEKMLNCLYQWADDRQIAQWIEWFEEEDYFYDAE